MRLFRQPSRGVSQMSKQQDARRNEEKALWARIAEGSEPGRERVLRDLLAVEEAEGLEGDDARPLRLAQEFLEADLMLSEAGIVSTIVVFGSHLILSPEEAEAAVRRADTAEALAVAEQQRSLSAWYAEARRFATIVSERGGARAASGTRRNVVVTGGGPGIMEAANRGAMDAGAPSVGLNIDLPEEQPANPYTTPELTFHFRYFAIRKMHFAMRANALAIFPGGLGTLDELFEVLTLKQTQKMAPIPVLLFSRAYWQTILNFDALVAFGTIRPEDAALLEFVDTAEEAWARLVQRGLETPKPLREP